jgi:hypothetical protein
MKLSIQNILVLFVSLCFFTLWLFIFFRFSVSANGKNKRLAWDIFFLDIAIAFLFFYAIIGVTNRSLAATCLFSLVPLKTVMLFFAKKFNVTG